MDESERLLKLINEFKSEGYKIVKTGPIIKTALNINEETWKEFKKTSNSRGYKLQEAVTQALDLWILLMRD